MLVTKSSQLPQISPAEVCGFQAFEKLPGPWLLSVLAWLYPDALFPWGRSLEVRGLVKLILALGQCPEGH